ncbi:extracellular solute-binding protein [Bradyrhizobium sp. 18]|uniref:ABC transporter substrate-binding protein n=1 Tax=Bradyrhizobium sp. 18 TaxID=2782657 RepID=UPI001FFB925D|nr:extracellular solute-binding protein [Bradyrhizobium sp. 18]MCK1504511.1 polyamine ABC transporter substrate-binding protein [Bradyrhizobium sp. 18]
MKNVVSTVSRRFFLTAGAGALAAPLGIRASAAAAKSNSLTFTGYGGSYQEQLTRLAINPFTEETGIKVNVVPAPDLARVKAQLLTGNVEWDVFDGNSAQMASGSKLGFWEKLDLSGVDVGDLAVSPTSDAVVWGAYGSGFIWDPKKFSDGKHPATCAEFFDVKKFPGRRSLRTGAFGNLEAALLADGVLPKDMYPLDLNRAFRALDRLKPSIAVWATTNPQSISLVQTGEVDFASSFANRVKATTEPGGGVPLAFSFEQNLLDSEGLAVLKGAPNKENAMKFIAYLLRPEVQARMDNEMGSVPVSKKAQSMLGPEIRKWQVDLNNPKSLYLDAGYWADHREAVEQRFKEWILS